MQSFDEKRKHLETSLDDFNFKIRTDSLTALCELAESGALPVEPEKEIANLHCHSFFSYNGYGYSPTHLAWLAKKNGVKFMGVVDFDNLDGVDKFLDACQCVGVRGTAGIETRTFLSEFEQIEINSPGDPGILYHMGTGFTGSTAPDTAQTVLTDIRDRASNRNRDMQKKINKFLSPLHIDYEKDVLPLTPAGNATERHMVRVIDEKAAESIEDPVAFWSQKLGISKDAVKQEMKDPNKFRNTLRSKLMKRGSVGYVQPTVDSFPTVDDLHSITLACGALPCSAWLDGTSAGEQREEDLLSILIAKGAAAINIIPDRNWNITDTKEKSVKLEHLYRIIELANQLDLPILVGTEMNKFGQKLVDDFDAPELEPVREFFLSGAYFLYGHTRMQRLWHMGYQSQWAQGHFRERKTKNNFYESAGQLIQPKWKKGEERVILNPTLSPKEVLQELSNYKEQA